MDILAARKKAAELAKAARKALPAVHMAPNETEEPAAHACREEPAQQPAAHEAVQPLDLAPHQAVPVETISPTPPVPVPATLQVQDLEMLAFLLGSEEYVIPVDAVREVLTLREITPVPHTEEHILGVCSLRGAVLPVVDLTKRLGLAGGVKDEKSRIIVAGIDADDFVGLLVDRIRGVVRIPDTSVRPAPETVEKESQYLKGIARKDEKLYILLDLEKAVGEAVQER